MCPSLLALLRASLGFRQVDYLQLRGLAIHRGPIPRLHLVWTYLGMAVSRTLVGLHRS